MKIPLRLLPTLCPPLLLASLAAADVRLPSVFGDHMVLQRTSDVAVWGWAEPGERVSVRGSWSDDVASATADADGRWSTTIATPAAPGPFTLTVSGANEVTLEDVLVGEVWICSGQSNMEMHVESCSNAQLEIAAANHPRLRLFTARRAYALTPADDVTGSWAVCSPETVGSFSAAAYYFGRELQQELDVPVGLVHTSWGGTLCEAWTSAEALARFPEFAEPLAQLEKAAAKGEVTPSVADLQKEWWEGLSQKEPGLRDGWMKAGVAADGWSAATVPASFADVGLGDHDGTVWFRRTVELPADWAGKELVLELGPVDDMDLTYVNGQLVGETKVDGRWQEPRAYTVPAGVAQAGANVIAVCAVDSGGNGSLGVAGDVRPPMRLRPADAPQGSGVELEGAWQARAGASTRELGGFPRNSWFHQNYPTALSNGMLAPLVPFGMRGAIWYQGESNRPRAAQYRRLFPAMIVDWRARWGRGDFPFYFVQIAPYGYGGDGGQAAELREAQTMALSVPNTGMAVTMDIGNPRDIHPKNKQDVGRRLALCALDETYGRDVESSGPLFRSLVVQGNEARLYFDHARGLTTRDGAAPSHFTVAGRDRVFHPATARIDGETVVVTSEAVTDPLAVRYAWGAADEPNLANAAGLPAPSFRTDRWAPVSAAQ